MKRYVVFFCIIFFASNLAWGVRGPADVSTGPHNLSSGSPEAEYKTDEDSICVFCHTPHGGSLDGPLWNRNSPTPGSWSHYNSASMSTAIKGLSTSRPPSAESLICLSCHDGSVSVNHVINEPNDRTTPIQSDNLQFDTKIIGLFGVPGSRIGAEPGNHTAVGLLSDDHPISFSYDDVLASLEYTTGPKYNSLNTPVVAEGLGVKFYGGTNRVECSSCHDPHVNYNEFMGGDKTYAPFLITPNTNSLLCLACHNK